MNDHQHQSVSARGCVAAWVMDRLAARLLGKSWSGCCYDHDWLALTAFGIVTLFHQKQREVQVVMMIDQNDDQLE